MKVLFIDDEVSLIEIFKSILEIKGFEVDITSNLEDAKNLITNNYDYILVDYFMYNTTTLEFIKELLNNYSNKSVCVLTGSEDEKIYKNLRRIGVINFLKKPINYNQIIEKINEKK